jgi:hypothetical protein
MARRMPRRRCVGSTPTTESPAVRTTPPGTVSSNGKEPQPPTIAPPSRAANTRDGSMKGTNRSASAGVGAGLK